MRQQTLPTNLSVPASEPQQEPTTATELLADNYADTAANAAEIIITQLQLQAQNNEKDKQIAELLKTNKALVQENQQKEKRIVELVASAVNGSIAAVAGIPAAVLGNPLEQGVLNALSAHIAVIDVSGTIVLVNNAWRQFASVNGNASLSTTCVGINYLDICRKAASGGDKTAKKVLQGIMDVLSKKQESFCLDYPCHSPVARRWFNLQAMLIDGGEPMAIIAHQDVSDRFKTEIELKKINKSLEDYRFALDQSSILAITDSRGYINFANNNFCTISGYTKEELIGKTHAVINSGYHPKVFFADMWRTIKAGNVWRGEIRNKSKTGRYYWVDTTIVPFMDSANQPVQFLSIRSDITEKKNIAEDIAKTLKEKNAILESIGDAFFAVDKNWMVTYWNNTAEMITNKSRATVLGCSLWDVYPKGGDSISYEKYQKAIETGTTVHFETCDEATAKWYEINVYPSEDGLSVYLKDISERKNALLQLERLNEILSKNEQDLIKSNKDLEQFAYVASHDLQEPLRMVNSFLSLLKKKYAGLIDDEGKKYIDFAVDGAARMRRLILDLLEFSRVGRTGELLRPVNLNALVDDILVFLQMQTVENSATITVGPLPEIIAQQAPVRQVFQNLLSNALKYIRAGVPPQIHITARELPAHWQFAVADNGIGINKKFFSKIFVIFQRLHNKDEYSGTGMGLALTQKIVENMGGTIWLTSEEGQGSTFYFTIAKSKAA